MALQFIGVDPDTPEGGSPTVFIDTDTLELVQQGSTADDATFDEARDHGPVPGHETIHRMPIKMIPFLRKACDELEELHRQRQRDAGEDVADS